MKSSSEDEDEIDDIPPPADLASCISDGPVQPRLSKFPLTQSGSQKRAFSASNYDAYPFIEYSVSADRIFCFVCRMFPPSSGYADPAYVKKGFCNWKNINVRVQKHAKSDCHKDGMSKWLGRKESQASGSVASKINEQLSAEITRNRSAVEKLSRIILLCGKQDLALRGHDERECSLNRGNFREILDLLRADNVETDTLFAKLPKTANYTSKDAQNELIGVIGGIISNNIVKCIKNAGMFTVIADEARDISCTQQMSVCVRFVNEGVVNERFLQFVDVHELNALSLSTVLADALENLGLDLSRCVSQCYDGASVMSGVSNGVQSRFRERCKSPCLYVHCHAHRLNLVLVNSCNNIPIFMEAIGLMEAVYAFFSASTLRCDKFKQTQISAGLTVLCLPMQSDTRWVCKHKAVTVFKKRYDCLVAALKHFSEFSTKGKERVEANGLLMQLQTFKFVFVLHLLDEILPVLSCTSVFMQKKSCDVARTIDVTQSTVSAVRNLRNEQAFSRLYSEVCEFCSKRDMSKPETVNRMQRCRKAPKTLDNFVVLETIAVSREGADPADQVLSYRVDMYAIIDRLLSELDRRFTENHTALAACSTVFPGHEHFLKFDVMVSLAEQFSYLPIDVEQLKAQTCVVRELVKRETNAVTLQTPEDLLQLLLPMRCAFPDVVTFVQLVLTIPVSSAQAERSFSCMKRVKTYLRSTMSDRRLNNLCLMSIEKEEADAVCANLSVVVDKFASQKQRRLNLII